VISPCGTPFVEQADRPLQVVAARHAEAEVIKADPVVIEPVVGGRDRPQAHQQVSAGHDDPAEQDLYASSAEGSSAGGDSTATSKPSRPV
jgi:hypothetical protein